MTAVDIGEGDFCYLRKTMFGYAVLPFLSRGVCRDATRFPTLTPAFHCHVWVYDDDPTPMIHLAHVPFKDPEDSWGRPAFYPPDAIEPCFKIHGVFNGLFSIIKPVSEADVAGLEPFRRYEPRELRGLLFSKKTDWIWIEPNRGA